MLSAVALDKKKRKGGVARKGRVWERDKQIKRRREGNKSQTHK